MCTLASNIGYARSLVKAIRATGLECMLVLMHQLCCLNIKLTHNRWLSE